MPIVEPTCDNPDELLAWPAPGPIDHIQIEYSATGGGAGFANIGSVVIAPAVRTYTFYDSNGLATGFWRWYFSNAANTFPTAGNRQYSAESQISTVDAYATLAMLRSFVRNQATSDATDEDTTEELLALQAGARAIDFACNRRFVLLPAAPRYYTPRFDTDLGRWAARIDDVMTQSGMIVKADRDWDGVYETTLTDYRLWPLNAAQVARPWTRIVFGFTASFTALLSQLQGSLEITVPWGWTSYPPTIVEANLLQASRFLKRRDSPYGVAGSPDMGNEMRLLAKLDPDVALMVAEYKRWEVN